MDEDDAIRKKKDGGRLRAAALAYDPEFDSAPRLVGKGGGVTAEKMISIAKANGVAIHSDPGLLDFLMRIDLEERIPYELYVAVAAVLALVYAADNDNPTARPPETFKRG